jgi:hypothetical protein
VLVQNYFLQPEEPIIYGHVTWKKHCFEICKKEYENDKVKLAEIQLFENTYTSDDALRWYTKTSFISSLLNKTLRMRNIHFLELFGFFIRYIHAQLVKL